MTNTAGCIGNTIITASGRYFDYNRPEPEQITIEDIAKALSNMCRYNGHCEFYSVAEHSVHCAELAKLKQYNSDCLLEALLHDAAEAYIGDMPKPLKIMTLEFRILEAAIGSIIAEKFKLKGNYKALVKQFDLQMLKAEKSQLFPNDKTLWPGFNSIANVNVRIRCWSPKSAEKRFLSTFALILEDRR